MADRTVKVTLQAVATNYISEMKRAAKATQETGTAAEKLAEQKKGLEDLGKVFLTIGGLAAAGVIAAVKSFADFDAQMSQVKTLSHATASEMDRLRNAALTMGQGIGFSATQVAEAETELVKAGVSVSDQLGGALKGSLDLAAAGQLNVADATSIAASAMTQFGLSGKDVPHIADLLASGADKALGSVQDLGQGLKYVGPVAASMGVSIDSTVGTLAELAQNGILADQAGTGLRGMLLSLTSPSTLAAKTMKEYGISVYDAHGKFIGFNGVAGQLQDHLGTLTQATRNQALGQIFGNEQITAATVLMQGGSSSVDKWTKSVNDQGFAAQQAAGKMDNLKGDLSKLNAAFDTAFIKGGSGANDTLRTATQSATALVSALGDVPQPVANVALGVGAVTAAVGLAGGTALLALPKIAEFRSALSSLQLSGKSAAAGIGVAGGAIGALSIAAGIFAASEAKIKQTTDELTASMDQGSGAFTTYSRAVVAKALADKGAFDAAKKAGISQGELTTAILQGGAAYDDVKKKVDKYANPLDVLVKGTAGIKLKASTEQIRSDVEKAAKNFGDLKQAGADSTAKTASGLSDVAGAAVTAKQSISDLSNTIKGFGSAQLDTNSAQRAFQQAIDDAAKSLKDNGKTLDITADKGRANAAALDQIASSAISATAAIVNNGGSQADATKQMQAGRDAYIAASVAQGRSAEAANKLADGLKLIPADVSTEFKTAGLDAAKSGVDQYGKKVKSVPTDKYTKLVADKAAASKNLDDLTAKLKKVPSSKRTQLQAEIAAAQKKIDQINAAIIRVPVSHTTTMNVDTRQASAAAAALQVQLSNIDIPIAQVGPSSLAALAAKNSSRQKGHADGGHIVGPGTPTSDSIPAMLSNGEYVVKASSVSKYGVDFFDRVNAGHYANGGLVHLASGGAVTKAQRAAAAALKRQQAAAKRAAAAATKRAKALAKLNSDQFGFLSDVSRGNLTGSSAVDALYQRASSTTGVGQVAMLNTALQFDRSLTKLTKSSDAATSKLDDLKSASGSLASSVESSVGKTGVSGYTSAASLNRGLARTAANTKEFAGLLVTLQKQGVAPTLLSEIADMGTAQGLPLARSLAKSSATDIKSINSSYAAIGSYAKQAGQTVADANYKAQIAAADKNARSLEYQIAKQSLAIQRVIGHALRVPGYALGGFTGPGSKYDVAGLVHAGEFVSTKETTANPWNRRALEYMQAGGVIPGYAYGGYVKPNYMSSGNGASIDYALLAASIGAVRPNVQQSFEFKTDNPQAMAQYVARHQGRLTV